MKTKRNLCNYLFVAVSSIILCAASFVTINHAQQSYADSAADMTEFEKAFQEVAYAYYMRGTSLQYNIAKGTIKSPEESTPQDNNYLACAFFVANVYHELIGLSLSHNDDAYYTYGRDYIGERPEVIGYGKLQESGDLFWYDGSKNSSGELNAIENPTQDYIISELKIGDILEIDGHVMLVYEYIYDNDRNIVEVYLRLSTVAGNAYTRAKTDGAVSALYYYDQEGIKKSLPITYAPWARLYRIDRDMTDFSEASIANEGTVQLTTFKYEAEHGRNSLIFDRTNPDNVYRNNYAILRFVTTDGSGRSILNFNGGFRYFEGADSINEVIEYSDGVKSRMNYSKLYIEKTIDKRDHNTVSENDELTYQIIIKNGSNQRYAEDLIVTENLSEFVDYLSAASSEEGLSVQLVNDKLTWNLGKLEAGKEIILQYTVRVRNNTIGKTIESTGKVANISSGTVKNKVGNSLTDAQASLIEEKYDELKDEYFGKELINKIYEDALGLDLVLDSFNMVTTNENDENGLIYYNNKFGSWINLNNDVRMSIIEENVFSKMVLNGYFNMLYKSSTTYGPSINGEYITIYSLAGWGDEERNNPDDRMNTVYPEDFETGDILIYNNTDDYSYYYGSGDEQNIKKWAVTRENGDYYYIYIDGEGFVGVNAGLDEGSVQDDRNEFNSTYFDSEHQNITMISKNDATSYEITDEIKEWMQYQSLFGKNSYVILRPSLILGTSPDDPIDPDDPADPDGPADPDSPADPTDPASPSTPTSDPAAVPDTGANEIGDGGVSAFGFTGTVAVVLVFIGFLIYHNHKLHKVLDR